MISNTKQSILVSLSKMVKPVSTEEVNHLLFEKTGKSFSRNSLNYNLLRLEEEGLVNIDRSEKTHLHELTPKGCRYIKMEDTPNEDDFSIPVPDLYEYMAEKVKGNYHASRLFKVTYAKQYGFSAKTIDAVIYKRVSFSKMVDVFNRVYPGYSVIFLKEGNDEI